MFFKKAARGWREPIKNIVVNDGLERFRKLRLMAGNECGRLRCETHFEKLVQVEMDYSLHIWTAIHMLELWQYKALIHSA